MTNTLRKSIESIHKFKYKRLALTKRHINHRMTIFGPYSRLSKHSLSQSKALIRQRSNSHKNTYKRMTSKSLIINKSPNLLNVQQADKLYKCQ